MRLALEHAAVVTGATPTVLHATDAGRPVYERMGYRRISTHTLFMEKRFLEGHWDRNRRSLRHLYQPNTVPCGALLKKHTLQSRFLHG